MRNIRSTTGHRTERPVRLFIFIYLLTILAALGLACGVAKKAPSDAAGTNSSPKPVPADVKPVPAPLADAGELGENIYDAAKAGDWKTAESKLEALQADAGKMPLRGGNWDKFSDTLKRLKEAVSGKKSENTLVESNRITFEVAVLSSGYDTKIPIGVTKLDFLGRELEIWSAQRDSKKLKETVLSLRHTWDGVKPEVEKAGGGKQAQTFESLVVKAEKAKSAAEYGKLATPILDRVDDLEGVFSS